MDGVAQENSQYVGNHAVFEGKDGKVAHRLLPMAPFHDGTNANALEHIKLLDSTWSPDRLGVNSLPVQ
jgi:hypothetical protein